MAEETSDQAELIELLGEVGTYPAELEAYQLHYGIKPCRYPAPPSWALRPLAEPAESLTGTIPIAGRPSYQPIVEPCRFFAGIQAAGRASTTSSYRRSAGAGRGPLSPNPWTRFVSIL